MIVVKKSVASWLAEGIKQKDLGKELNTNQSIIQKKGEDLHWFAVAEVRFVDIIYSDSPVYFLHNKGVTDRPLFRRRGNTKGVKKRD